MATFSIHAFPNGIKGSRFEKKADREVLMGALVAPGTAATGDVMETVDNNAKVLGVAVIDEAMARQNESSGVAQEKYADNDPVIVEGLVNGVVYNLLSSGTVTEGDVVEAAAGGLIASGTTHPIGTAVSTAGVAASTATQQSKYPVQVLVQRMYDWD